MPRVCGNIGRRRNGTPTASSVSGLAEPRIGALVERILAAGFDLALFDITSDSALPCFLAVLADRRDPQGHPGMGSACHPSAALAILKTLLEAVQVRTSYIAGARDDLAPEEFGAAGPQDKLRWVEALLAGQRGVLRPSMRRPASDLASTALLERLAGAG